MVKAFARCLSDKRAPEKIRHTLADLIGQRIFGIACGHPDCNDAEHLAADPIHKLLLGRDPVAGESLASQPTLSRFENAAGRGALWSWPDSVDTYPLGEEEESTMPKSRPPYAAAFRQQMVELVRSGRTPGELAREFEPSAEAIRNWVAQADRDAGERTDGLSTEDGEELRRLRRENRRLREEREILAKATAWFARETGSGRSTGS